MRNAALNGVRPSAGLLVAMLATVATLATVAVLTTAQAAAQEPFARLTARLPSSPSQFSADRVQRLAASIDEIERWAVSLPLPADSPDQLLNSVRRLLEAQHEAARALDAALALRVQFGSLPDDDRRPSQLCAYLRVMTLLIDLNGRLRTAAREAIEMGAYHLDARPAEFHRLLDLLAERRAAVGAEVMSYMLFDPAADTGAKPYTTQEKYQVLNLILLTRHYDLLPYVAAFIRQEKNPSLVVIAAELIRRLGLPQKPRPGDEAEQTPQPLVAEELREILAQVKSSDLPAHLTTVRDELMQWLQRRIEHGVEGDSFRLGSLELRAGDWLLMRNPSPYNLFTNLSPGLFTHVGVVAVEQGSDGIRRFVIVDLPERGARIPATNVEAFLTRTLNYVFLRHEDPQVGTILGQAAADMIGNESQFDLQFDTHRVAALEGQPLHGALIHTYCAGFLLTCTLPTSRPRDEFFPIVESAAGGNMVANLKQLGLAFGQDFLSPTGALFSSHLQIAGRREPVYDPGRAVQEAIYDHFADCMIRKVLTPSPDAFQALRERLAKMAKHSPWLANALARTADVNARMDLEAAARTAAVIETLDEIAEENLNEFAAAYGALLQGLIKEDASLDDAQKARIQAYQQQHADLARRRTANRVTPHELREQLVRFYADRGRGQIESRFFATPGQPAASPPAKTAR